jgi:hypothetical protein
MTTLDRRQFIRSVCVGAATGAPAVKRLGAETKPRAAFTLGLGTYTFRNQDIHGLIERLSGNNLSAVLKSCLTECPRGQRFR